MAVERAEQITLPADGPSIRERPQPRLFDVDEYYRLAEIGVLRPDENVELIEGEIVLKFRITPRRAAMRMHLNMLFIQRMSDLSHVGINHPLRLSRWHEPEPDMTFLKLRPDERVPYPNEHPDASDTHVVIEVVDLGVDFVLGEKADLYARYGIPELWVFDLPGDRLVVHREPTADGYASVAELPRGASISPVAFPDVTFTADELLGEAVAEATDTEDEADAEAADSE